MDRITISTARVYFESRMWPQGVRCPVCEATENITTRKRVGFYRCNQCHEDFTVCTGTIFERSHIPLHKWLYAMYLLVTARKGISSLQLSKQIGVTQKTAWFMLHRLREACGSDLNKLQGVVEVDETHLGGIEQNKHESKKLRAGRGAVGKATVVGLRERGPGGRVIAEHVLTPDAATLQGAIFKHVESGSQIYTDESPAYSGLNGLFFLHDTVNHTVREYVRGDVSTNSIESVWAVLERGVVGVYHKVSTKHLGRYVNEFAFRLNDGDVKRHTLDRLDSMIALTVGKRLTFARLTA